MYNSMTGIPTSTNHSQRPRLLVVDGDAAIRELHALVLNLEGYDVETACEGPDALERLATEKFDLAVIDRATPLLDGASMTLALRSAGSKIPIVMVSGSPMQQPLLPGVACEIAATVPKPARTAEIRSAVAYALRGVVSPKSPRHFSRLPGCEPQPSAVRATLKGEREDFASPKPKIVISIVSPAQSI